MAGSGGRDSGISSYLVAVRDSCLPIEDHLGFFPLWISPTSGG